MDKYSYLPGPQGRKAPAPATSLSNANFIFMLGTTSRKKKEKYERGTPEKILTCPNILNMQIFQSVAAFALLFIFILFCCTLFVFAFAK